MHYADVASIQPTVIAYNFIIKSNVILFSRGINVHFTTCETLHTYHRILPSGAHISIHTYYYNTPDEPPLARPGSIAEWEIVVAQHARLVVSGNLYKLPLSTYTIFFCNGQCPNRAVCRFPNRCY